jgi:hypothetical protein
MPCWSALCHAFSCSRLLNLVPQRLLRRRAGLAQANTCIKQVGIDVIDESYAFLKPTISIT